MLYKLASVIHKLSKNCKIDWINSFLPIEIDNYVEFIADNEGVRPVTDIDSFVVSLKEKNKILIDDLRDEKMVSAFREIVIEKLIKINLPVL
jgi:hypothetical protein